MKKTDKKIDKQICQALTIACEAIKTKANGFQWLTHFVDFNQFPDSLSVVCIFNTSAELDHARQHMKDQTIVSLIKNELEKINIKLKDISRHISFETEDAFIKKYKRPNMAITKKHLTS